MNSLLLLCSIVLILCVFSYKFLSKFGVPMLLVFIFLGMLFGENGLLKINFNDFKLAKDLCTFALIFIIFFGGFGTNLSTAKIIFKKAIILSTLGVFFTTVLTALFVYYFLKIDLIPSFLIGAVLSSTDAASVFSILRSHKLNLKENTAPILEMESGSNDPFAYVLTLSFLTLSSNSFTSIIILLFKQTIIGLIVGAVIVKICIYILKKIHLIDRGFTMAFIFGSILLSYAISEMLGGNGYLTIYILGIFMGNSNFNDKVEIIHFFDGITSITQMLIFFLLGLLIVPKDTIPYLFPAFIIMITLTFVVRPIVVEVLMSPFKVSKKQKLLVSWAGLRGAASVVFSILIVVNNRLIGYPIFNIVFVVIILSIAIQGSLLPYFSKKISMIDENENVLKTFSDYSDKESVDFITLEINKDHRWNNKKIRDIELIPSLLLVLIVRKGENIIPKGDTLIMEGDQIVLCGSSFKDKNIKIKLYEKLIDKTSDYLNKKINELEKDILIISIQREAKTIIPRGETILKENDILVIVDR